VKHLKTKRKSFKQNKNKEEGDVQSPLLINLYHKKAEVEKTIFSLLEMQQESMSLDESIEEFDRAEKEISAKMYYSLLERKNDELKKINLLIHKVMNNHDFGYCEECGERINPKRLLVMPEATLCIDCQSEIEKAGRLYSGGRSFSDSKWQAELEDENIDDSDILDDIIMKEEMASLSLAEMEEIDIIDAQSEEKEEEEEDNIEPGPETDNPES
jgi:DnaK suppressor protein